VADAALRELLVKGALAPPGDVLGSVVGEHFLGGPVSVLPNLPVPRA
jgi:hypothetical protein